MPEIASLSTTLRSLLRLTAMTLLSRFISGDS